MMSVEQLFPSFQQIRTVNVLGSEFTGCKNDEGTRLVVPVGVEESLATKPEVAELLSGVLDFGTAHDGFNDVPAIQQNFNIKVLRTAVNAGEWTKKGLSASVYHDLGSRSIIKAFDIPAPHEGATQFAIMACLADQLPVGRLKVPMQYALIQSAHSFHQTVIMEAVDGHDLNRMTHGNPSEKARHIRLLEAHIIADVPRHLQPYINDATDHLSNIIYGADGSYTLLDQPLVKLPVLARRSLSMRALDRLLS